MAVSLKGKDWAIIALTVATAVIHLVLGFSGNTLFILNGLGYLGLLGMLYLPLDFLDGYRGIVRWVLIVYTIITIVLFFAFNWQLGFGPLGLITKAIELVLVVLLFMDTRA